jgi:hypothetical protein
MQQNNIQGHKMGRKAFIDKHMPSGLYTELYLSLRWEWMNTINPGKQLNYELRKAYEYTDACKMYHGYRYKGSKPSNQIDSPRKRYRRAA